MRLYLAGGMKGWDWQSYVIDELREYGYTFINPKVHGLHEPRDYTQWDLGGVAIADGILGFMETNNPSGIGLALEIGMAIGMGKPVFFADESKLYGRFAIVRHAVSISTESLNDLVEHLKRRVK